MATARVTHRRKTSPGIDDAVARYARLSRPKQMRVLLEMMDTRSVELARAYEGVVRIGIGQRRRRDAKGKPRLEAKDPVCVWFMVTRKWSRRASTRRAGAIPKHLLAYAEIRGAHRLVAVPTDVDAHWLKGALPHASIEARIDGS